MRQLDRECEARLYHERVNQELGIDKFSRISIKLRKELEEQFCLNFKRFISRTAPESAKLWDRLNPDIPRLLKLFETYLTKTKRNTAH
jgi:hypothetical protein